MFWLVYLLTLSIGIMVAYFVAILSPNMDVANAALPTYVVCLRPMHQETSLACLPLCMLLCTYQVLSGHVKHAYCRVEARTSLLRMPHGHIVDYCFCAVWWTAVGRLAPAVCLFIFVRLGS